MLCDSTQTLHSNLSVTAPVLVSGWLDDIGLPQYKSHFDEARVDGRMLHYMTVVSCRVRLVRVTLRRSPCGDVKVSKKSLDCFPRRTCCP